MLIVLSLIISSSQGFAQEGIDAKFLTLFQAEFPKADSVSWEDFDFAYAVNFIDEGVQSRITYSKDGSNVRVTRFYNETSIPYMLKYISVLNYPGKIIASATENNILSKTGEIELFYYLILEDSGRTLTIRVNSNGNREILNRSKKK
jgi:hypothetical protein